MANHKSKIKIMRQHLSSQFLSDIILYCLISKYINFSYYVNIKDYYLFFLYSIILASIEPNIIHDIVINEIL